MADGPLTVLANLAVRTDENGYLLVTGADSTVHVATDGALTGDGSVATPLSVAVDGVTVVKVGNVLTAPSGGGGTIGGNVGASDNRIVRSDGAGGSTIQGSAAILSDAGALSGITLAGSLVTGAYTSSAMTLGTAKMLGRATASTGVVEEIATTGTGSAVLATGGTLVGPILGTPASGNLTNCLSLPDGGLTLTNVTTNDVSTARHGFAPRLSNVATEFLSGTGVYSIPGGGGNVLAAYQAKTGNYTLIWGTDGTVELTTNAGTFTLPTAVGHGGSGFIVKNAQTANALTLATTSSQTIDGASPGTLTNGALGMISDGANWRLVSDLGLGLTSLTSGGVIYAASAAMIASSAALAANNLVLGGGAGAAPFTAPGIDSDGVSVVSLGEAGVSQGSLTFKNQTSGTIDLQAAATGGLGTRVLTLPIATDTLVGKATADVFTNKTLDTVATGNVFKINGEQVNSIGSGLDITGGVLDASGAGGLTSAFTSAVVSGQTTISTSGSTALTVIAGTNITLTTDNTAKSLTIDASGGGGSTDISVRVYQNAEQTIAGATSTPLVFQAESFDTDTMHYTSDVALTGTVTKTSGSPTVTGSSTLFSSELSVGQVVVIPGGGDDYCVVTAIGSNTSMTVASASQPANSASGQTALRFSGGLVARTAGKYAIHGKLLTHSTTTTGVLQLILNNATTLDFVSQTNGGSTSDLAPSVQTIYSLAQWDLLYVSALISSGPLNTFADVGYTFFEMHKLY